MGMSAAFLLLTEGLRARGWRIEVLNLGQEEGGKRAVGAVSLQRARRILGLLARATTAIPRNDIVYLTVAQSRWGFFKDAIILLLARAFRRSSVVHLHGGAFDRLFERQPGLVKTAIRFSLARVARFIVLSDCFLDQFAMVDGGRERSVVVPNACNVATHPPRRAPDGRLRVLFLSNLMIEKGYLDLLAAASLTAERLPDWTLELHFAGNFLLTPGRYRDPKEMEHAFHEAAALPPGVHVTWHGSVTGDAKEQLLANTDVFVLPTYYENEGQPIALLEAMTAALPVVATDYRAIPETLPTVMHSLLVPIRDPAAIADRLVALAKSPESYEEASRAAAAAAASFRPETHIDHIARLLAELSPTGYRRQRRNC